MSLGKENTGEAMLWGGIQGAGLWESKSGYRGDQKLGEAGRALSWVLLPCPHLDCRLHNCEGMDFFFSS